MKKLLSGFETIHKYTAGGANNGLQNVCLSITLCRLRKNGVICKFSIPSKYFENKNFDKMNIRIHKTAKRIAFEFNPKGEFKLFRIKESHCRYFAPGRVLEKHFNPEIFKPKSRFTLEEISYQDNILILDAKEILK